jgi:hypothetical protein
MVAHLRNTLDKSKQKAGLRRQCTLNTDLSDILHESVM